MKIKLVSEEKIRTEKPLEELWLQLRLFESEYYSKQFLKEKYHDISDEELNKLTTTFTSNIKQAYEYYSAASSVSILTSPLLYYYGMMCLTNVLWASLNKNERIKQSHGLRSKSDGSDHILSNEYVTVLKEGSFPALHSCFSDFTIKQDTKIFIKDVFSVIPELKILFEKIYERSCCVKFTRDRLDYNHEELIPFREMLENNIDFFHQHNVPIYSGCNLDDISVIDIIYDCVNDSTIFEYPLQKNLNGEIYFTFPIDVGNNVCAVPEASAHFIVMYCLGMLVRYEPEKWLQIVSGKLSSEINLINRFVEISKRKFPNIILNGLLGKEVQFTMADEGIVKPELKWEV